MPIEQIFETREDAPEFLRNALLENADGKFVFQAELPHEVQGLKTALNKERESKKQFEAELKKYDGIDVETAKQALQRKQELDAQAAQAKGDWAAREKQLQEQLASQLTGREKQYQTEIESRDERIKALQQSLDRYLIEAQATAAITAAKGTPELLMPHIARQVKIVEEDGAFVARVVDSQGQPRIADIKGTPFSIRHLVEEMKNDPVYGRAFEASGAGGSGASNATRASGKANTLTRAAFNGLNPSDRMQFVKSGGAIVD